MLGYGSRCRWASRRRSGVIGARLSAEYRGERIESILSVGTARTDLDLLAMLHAERHQSDRTARVSLAPTGKDANIGSERAQRSREERRRAGMDAMLEADPEAVHGI